MKKKRMGIYVSSIVSVSLFITLILLVAFQASAQSKATGHLRIAQHDLLTEALDPMKNSNLAAYYLNLMYNDLVGVDVGGKVNFDYGLAQKWVSSPDGKTHTFYLRKGIKFHNGDEVTAEDVAFSWERYWGPKSMVGGKRFKAIFEKVEVSDPYTLIVHTKTPKKLFPYDETAGTYGLVVPKKYILEKGEDYFLKHPIGSGPYKFAGQSHGDYIKLEANENYWRGAPRWKSITFKIVPEQSTRIVMLKRGEIDFTPVSIEKGKELEKAGFKIMRKRNGVVHGIRLNEQYRPDSITNDIRIREAMSLAINRQELLDTLFLGYGSIALGWPAGSYAFGADTEWKPPYDPKRAQKLLKEAGYPKAFKYPVLVVNNIADSKSPETQLAGEAMAAMWQAVGFKVKIVPSDYASFRGKVIKHTLGPSNVTIKPGTNKRSYEGPLRFLYHSKGAASHLKDSRPEMDAIFADLGTAKNEEEYSVKMLKLNHFINANYISIPTIETDYVFACSRDLRTWDLGKRFDYAISLVLAK